MSRALRGQGDLFEHRQREELERIAQWASDGPEEGIRQEISPAPSSVVWDQVNADSSLCSPKNCQPDTCFYRRARSRVDQADLVILNHSLLFSLIGAGIVPSEDDSGVLFPDDFVIFDEAHEIPDVASDHLGILVSSWAMESFFKKLYNAKKGKGVLKELADPAILKQLNRQNWQLRTFLTIYTSKCWGKETGYGCGSPTACRLNYFLLLDGR